MRTAHGWEQLFEHYAVADVDFDGHSSAASHGLVLRYLRSGAESCQGRVGLSVLRTVGTVGKAEAAQL